MADGNLSSHLLTAGLAGIGALGIAYYLMQRGAAIPTDNLTIDIPSMVPKLTPVTVSGILTTNGVPVANETVYLFLLDDNGTPIMSGYTVTPQPTTTSATGQYSFSCTITDDSIGGTSGKLGAIAVVEDQLGEIFG